MPLAETQAGLALKGIPTPRIAPPVPARSLLADYRAAAKELGIKLMPWQVVAIRYLSALGPRGKWLYRDVAEIVARQNGKNELFLPHILVRLRMGRRLLHTAQNRSLPRETFLRLAVYLDGRAETDEIRYANGQEVIKLKNGGRYTLVAPRPGARGNAVDDIILDEIREQRGFDLIGAIKPTMTASRNPQVLYASNAGDEDSVVLNDLRRRAETDPRLCYLEWSASPERANDDREGWCEANPALGITIQPETLEDNFRSLPPHVWETEHLCRWVASTQPRLVADAAWQRCHVAVEKPLRPMLAISMDASGRRASGVIAWQQSDGTIGLQVVADVTGEPIDTGRFGPDVLQVALRLGVAKVAYDPLTDAELAKHLRTAKPITGLDWANACARFIQVIDAGRLHWDGADAITEDLGWTARRPHDAGQSGAFTAVKVKEERPVTAVLAAIRAVWLASGPKIAAPRVM